MKVVQVGVAGFSGEHGSTWNAILAASTVAIIPTLTLYFVLQRFIVRSIKMTGLKG